MRTKQWIKASLLTATLIGLTTPVLARPNDNEAARETRSSGGRDVRARADLSVYNGGERGQSDRGQNVTRPAPMQVAPPQANNRPAPNAQPPRAQPPRAQPPVAQPNRPPVAQSPAGVSGDNRGNWSGRSGSGWQNQGDRGRDDRNVNNRGGNDGNRDWRGRDGNAGRDRDRPQGGRDNIDRDRSGRDNDWRNNDRRDNWNDRNRRPDVRPPVAGRPPVANRPPITNRWQGQRQWNNSWRRDNRYDWQGWRYTNRDVFRLPRYYAPYGYNYGYSRFSIGAYIDTILFGATYWIDDPYRYRLPPAYGNMRWIRYYDDALLIDIRDGYVVDVVHDVFW
jgi:hypothetical protein